MRGTLKFVCLLLIAIIEIACSSVTNGTSSINTPPHDNSPAGNAGDIGNAGPSTSESNAAAAPLTVSIVIPDRIVDGKIEKQVLRNDNPDEHFSVIIQNVTSSDINLWRTGNAINIGGLNVGLLSLQINYDDGDTASVTPSWFANTKTSLQSVGHIPGGKSATVDVYYCHNDIKSYFKFPANGEAKKATIRAIYEDAYTQMPGFWVGKAESEPVQATLVSSQAL